MTAGASLATAVRIAFLVASAPPIGAVLLLAIGRVTGAAWQDAALPPVAMRLVVIGGALIGLAQLASPPPPHLALWMHPLSVGARAIIATGGLAFAGARLRAGGGATTAAVTLALYAALVTPVATDWLLGAVPGHPVSAAGMMLFVSEIAAAGAIVLASGTGSPALRRDLGKLMIAAALGLGYLGFMDYLIVWFGNLPTRVGFYAVRDGAGSAALVWSALALGLAAPIALLSLGDGGRSERLAGVSVLIAVLLFILWWVGGDAAGSIGGGAIAVAALVALCHAKERAHG